MSRRTYKSFIHPIEDEPVKKEEVQPIIPEPPKPIKLYSIKVNHPSLRKRRGPSATEETVGLITDEGIYDIYTEENGWGKLEDNTWIMLAYTGKIKEKHE